MSPRAAWRLESLGFGEVYDYVGSKMEWIGAGLPWEGSEASQPRLGDLASADVALCELDDTVGVVRAALGQGPVCLVVNEERIVLGLVRAEALGPDEDRPVTEVMDEGPAPIGCMSLQLRWPSDWTNIPSPVSWSRRSTVASSAWPAPRTSPRRRDEQSHHPVDDHAAKEAAIAGWTDRSPPG